MDANQTRFQLVFGEADWFGPDAAGSSPSGGPGVARHRFDGWAPPEDFCVSLSPGATGLTAADRRGAGQDQYGNYYWVAPAARRDSLPRRRPTAGTAFLVGPGLGFSFAFNQSWRILSGQRSADCQLPIWRSRRSPPITIYSSELSIRPGCCYSTSTPAVRPCSIAGRRTCLLPPSI